jgi:hypothetical protein
MFKEWVMKEWDDADLLGRAAADYQTRVSNGEGERRGHEARDDTGYMVVCGRMEARAEGRDEQRGGVVRCKLGAGLAAD